MAVFRIDAIWLYGIGKVKKKKPNKDINILGGNQIWIVYIDFSM